MKPYAHQNTNTMLAPPEHFNEAEEGGVKCVGLPVHRTVYGGRTHFTSYWKPTLREKWHLLLGGAVAVEVIGAQPPIYVETVL